MAGLIVSILAFLFVSLFSAYMAYLEFRKEKADWVKFGIFVILTLGTLYWGVVDKVMSYYSTQQDKTDVISADSTNTAKTARKIDGTDSLIDSGFKNTGNALDGISKKLDNGFGKLSPSHPYAKNDPPNMQICPEVPGGINPIIAPTNKIDSFVFKIKICNKGGVDAINLHDHLGGVAEQLGQYYILSDSYVPSFGKYDKVAPQEYREIDLGLTRNKVIITANHIICFKLLFTSVLGGQDSLVEMYNINLDQINTRLSKPNSIQQNAVEKIIREKKGW